MLKQYDYQFSNKNSDKSRKKAAIVITDQSEYLNSRILLDEATELGFISVNMPHLIELLENKYLAPIIRSLPTDTDSGIYHGTIKNNRIHITAHGDHPLTSPERLSEVWSNRIENGFMIMFDDETKKLITEAVPISDVRKGYNASNQAIAINLDKDRPMIARNGHITYDKWMIDDYVLSVCGNQENRESLGKYLFKIEKKREIIRNTHNVFNMPYDKSIGQLMLLGGFNSGINFPCGSNDYKGRFIGSNHPKYVSERMIKKD